MLLASEAGRFRTIAATVTIDKAYFETLLRRAELHTSGRDLTTPLRLAVVTIPKVDHDNLLQMAREYSALREALYCGGISPETLDILIHGAEPLQPANPTLASNGAETTGDIDYSARPLRTPLARLSGNAGDNSSSQGTGWSTREFGGTYPKDKTGLYSRQYSFGREDSPYPSGFDRDDRSFPQPKAEKPYYNRAEQRTIVAQNLSDRTTHKDIVNILRGGAVLDIFLRSNERSASISFVEGSAAQEFMSYVKRNDIYILGKRIDFAWNDRQFLLPGHVANKISIGATRNLIIRGVHAKITEERLREDLDHIHNLVIIKISYNNGDAHLSLNSVHNALFARTCMMSRAMYKGMKIEWYSDECALPLPRQQWTPRKENTPKPVKRSNTAVNRFQMLNMDGTEDNSDGGNDENEDSGTMLTEGLSSLKLSHRSPWNPTVAA